MRFRGPAAAPALLASLALLAASDAPIRAATRERVYILGFDGMDPDMVDRLIAQGRLPNLAWMKQHGAMRRLGTTNPAQSPVAWSSFSTGMNPGKTRIYDFLRRNPATYYPDFSTVDAEGRIPCLVIPIEFQRVPGASAVRISLQGQVRTIPQGAWSDWYKIRFTIAPLIAVNGIARFHVMEASPELRVYLSPINFDPRRPPVPISKPNRYS